MKYVNMHKKNATHTLLHEMVISTPQHANVENRRINLGDLLYSQEFKTQKTLAKKLGISESTLSRQLNGNEKISYETATIYEDKLGLPQGYLTKEKSRVYILANINMSGSNDPIESIVRDLKKLNQSSLSKSEAHRPISAVRPVLGEFGLLITLDVFDSNIVNKIVAAINGIKGICSTSSLIVMSKYEM